MTFFLCNGAQVTAGGCVSGGSQVGGAKAIVAGSATSDPSSALQFNGKYCWRTLYTPDPTLAGIYEPATHTNATTECFTVAGGATLPNTGLPLVALPASPWLPVAGLALLPLLAAAFVWRRARAVAALVIAGLVAGASPAAPAPVSRPAPAAGHVAAAPSPAPASSPSPQLATIHAHDGAWRLVIPRIDVDAPIDSVGLDRTGAMAAPATLDHVGWYDAGPSPGQAGDAVVDGHFGAEHPAVFRNLRLLRPGDQVRIVWPNGHTISFTVTAAEVVKADARPAGVFSTSGPARLTLITCAGAWDPAAATYVDRLLVTAVAG